MGPEQCQGDALQPKADARAMRGLAVRGTDPESVAEVIEMIVARGDGGGPFDAGHGNDQLVFEVLLLLGGRHHPAAAAEERVIGRHWPDVQPYRAQHFLGLVASQ